MSGRPPLLLPGEQVYRLTLRLSASQIDSLGDWALERDLTRKTRGEDSRSPDLGGAAREALVLYGVIPGPGLA